MALMACHANMQLTECRILAPYVAEAKRRWFRHQVVHVSPQASPAKSRHGNRGRSEHGQEYSLISCDRTGLHVDRRTASAL